MGDLANWVASETRLILEREAIGEFCLANKTENYECYWGRLLPQPLGYLVPLYGLF